MQNEQLNRKHKIFYKILKEASISNDPVSKIKSAIKFDSRIIPVLGYAFNPQFKFKLPEGMPPYIPSQHPLEIAPLEILMSVSKWYVMCNEETKQYKKEELFVQWLEDMAPEEAELMVFIKDQNLEEAFGGKITVDHYMQVLGWDKQKWLQMKAASKI